MTPLCKVDVTLPGWAERLNRREASSVGVDVMEFEGIAFGLMASPSPDQAVPTAKTTTPLAGMTIEADAAKSCMGPRTILVRLDPGKLRSYNMSPLEVLDVLVQRRRDDSRAALRLMRKLLKEHHVRISQWVRCFDLKLTSVGRKCQCTTH
jgi:hypothetical protein